MSFIGFELVSMRSLSVLPNETFYTSILWNEKKLPSSIGKDRYHEQGLILPDKRFAATGRIHHLSKKTINPFESLQTSPCLLIQCPDTHPSSLHIEILLSTERLVEAIEQNIGLYFLREENRTAERIPIYLDPQSIQKKQPSQLFVDLSFLIHNYW